MYTIWHLGLRITARYSSVSGAEQTYKNPVCLRGDHAVVYLRM